VPNLLPYYGNRLSIDDTDVPIDRMVNSRDVTLAPPFRGGAIAVFPAPRERRASGRLLADGDLPALEGRRALEAVVSLSGPSSAETWLGADGGFYVEGLEPGTYVVEVSAPDVKCRATIELPASDEPVVRLGEIFCRAVGP
jgi:outer membrane usher protein FimD/PapC